MTTETVHSASRWRPKMATAAALFVLLAVSVGSVFGQVDCPARCTCEGETADCSSSRLDVPPSNFPADTKTINIEGNHIRVLGSRSFTHLPNIETLKAAGNRIRRLNNEAFSQTLPHLMTLDLSRNRIRRIMPNAFNNMGNLSTLDLSKNHIPSARRIFQGTPNILQVQLTRNKITRLGENDLAPLYNVHSVDLKGNKIASVHPRAFKNLTSLRYLFLQHNPLGRMPEMDFGTETLQMVDLSHDRLTRVPKPFPASTKDMRLDHNLVERVNHTDFLSIENLRMLTMNDNLLNYFADGALAHMTELQEVWLRNNRLVYVPRDLPDSVKRIHMNDNRVQQVETGLFRETSQLLSLSLSSNRINRIQPNTFQGLRALQSLNFQANLITALETDTFVDLGSLSTLRLSNNPLQRIDQGAFRNLANLTYLGLSYIEAETFDLAYNFLPEMLRLKQLKLFASPGLAASLLDKLTEGHLTPLSFLETLDVSHSNLVTVPARVRELFPNLRAFPLDDNPLRCTQSLRWLKQWMDEAGSTVQFYNWFEPTCSSPPALRGRPLSSLLDYEWVSDDAAGSPSLTPGGAYDAQQLQGGVAVADQPKQQEEMTQSRRGAGRGFAATLVKVQSARAGAESDDRVEEKSREAGKVPQPMKMVSAETGGVKDEDEDEKPGKTAKPKKKNNKRGKKGKNRRNGGKKGMGKRGGRKSRKDRKDRERKRRRRITKHASRMRKAQTKKSAQ